ncbi:MAG: carboxy terminal-processing peptidase [Kiritimatiellales bacterium]
MQKCILFLSIFAALLTGCGRPPANAIAIPPAEEKPLPADRIAARLADRLPRVHLNRALLDAAISTNALALYIDTLDYDHTWFLASDIEEFRQSGPELYKKILDGDTAFAHTVFERFKERVTDRVEFTYALLDKGFNTDKDEVWQWKRDQAPWAESEAEWDDLWRRKIKNEYVSRCAAIEADAKNKKEHPADETAEAKDKKTGAEKNLSPDEFVRERYKQFKLLIDTNYDHETILQRYLSSFTRSYDPHSDYLSPRSVEDFDIAMSLSLVGVGATLRSEDGMAKVIQIIKGGPADKDGRLETGDKIMAVAQGDGEAVSILHWPLSKAVRQIRGEKGTKVVLTVIPADDITGTRTKEIDLIRDEVKLEEQAAKGEVREILTPADQRLRFGILTLPEFYADFDAVRAGKADARRAAADVKRILTEFNTNSVDGVIFDLRNDGGGSLADAIEIAGFFIPLGPIVQVREQRGVSVLPDNDISTLYDGPLIILVNRLSASASEIVAAAMQDYGRAVIVGDAKTHGKGTVQSVFPLSRLSDELGSLKATTASFYRIAGGSTQLKGVQPDVILPSIYDAIEIGEEFLPNALPWTQVRNAYYRPWSPSVKPYLPELQTRSGERTANDEEFKKIISRRDRIQKRMNTPEVSLKLTDRIAEIVNEKEIEDVQDKMEELLVRTDEDENEKLPDPVLDETIRILTDFIEISAGTGMLLAQ